MPKQVPPQDSPKDSPQSPTVPSWPINATILSDAGTPASPQIGQASHYPPAMYLTQNGFIREDR